ncbi:hypothetical protein [Buttiauxella sp. A111]|uniref:hypothetical protein n=1 Tax=Buttiauxella sp. A111 TaxID=2563088 RepID=UPI0010D016B7|nr:hypothetical protein [Buttiauxella sp. A111]GDX06349.1 hypothetical protein BSPA111_25580 [Buttiauxella sp. A111]
MTVQNDNQPNVSSQSTAFDVAALFRDATPAPEVNEGDENRSEAQQPDKTTDDASQSDLSPGDESSAGNGESIYQFDGAEYTAEQVTAALKHHNTNEAFSQSIAPLVDNIKQFHDQAARFQAMAVTETDKQIEELQRALASGQLNAQDYQLAHQSLQQAQTRKGMLEAAAQQTEAKRQQALSNARRQNAANVATQLVKRGWTADNMKQAQGIVQGVMNMDQFADVVSPAFMEILKDAYAYRSQRETAAAKLQQQTKKVIKTGKGTTAATPPKVKETAQAGSSEWMQSLWGGK